jgi:Tfp pilus assembly protein PilF
MHVPDPGYQETQDDLVRSERAIRRFDDAREVFRRGEYGRANELIDEAIELLPNDPSLHQFRALVLAARQRFQESAAALYSVLAVSPGWDRETILKLYDKPETYVSQMDALERFATSHPEAIESRFLLAYHYLINGNSTGAKQQLEAVRIANPNDRVVQNLLSALG